MASLYAVTLDSWILNQTFGNNREIFIILAANSRHAANWLNFKMLIRVAVERIASFRKSYLIVDAMPQKRKSSTIEFQTMQLCTYMSSTKTLPRLSQPCFLSHKPCFVLIITTVLFFPLFFFLSFSVIPAPLRGPLWK